MKKSDLKNIIREEIQIILEQNPKKGDFVENPHGKVKYRVIHTVSRGIAYIDNGNAMRSVARISDLTDTKKKIKGKTVWKDV